MENKYFKNIELEDNHCWIDVGKNRSVLIKKTEEGIAVDIFEKPKKGCFLEEPLGSTWVLDNE